MASFSGAFGALGNKGGLPLNFKRRLSGSEGLRRRIRGGNMRGTQKFGDARARAAAVCFVKRGWSNLHQQCHDDSVRAERTQYSAARCSIVASATDSNCGTSFELDGWGTSFLFLCDMALLPLLTCKWWLNVISKKKTKYTLKTARPSYLLPSLICCVFLFSSCFIQPDLLCSSGHVMVHLGHFTFPLCQENLILFLLMAWPLSLGARRHSFPFSPPTLSQRPSPTCRHLCFCPASFPHQPPTNSYHTYTSSWHMCLWLCENTTLCFTWPLS